ncbi:MAG TPA: hypothetical protein VMM35_05805 [Longimicrobiales bacterium]|nr:hypothetical protein [Longimicrobiales bacterium]
MPVAEGRGDVERLREAVDREVEQTSLRATARRVGMSPSGLRKFLEGAEPYSATRRKLERWYVHEVVRGYAGSLNAAAAEAALEVLLQDMAAARRADGRRQLIAALRKIYGEDRPAWLRSL